MQHDLLITGFGPFPRMTNNPSARLVRALARDGCWKRLGLRVKTHVFTTGYQPVSREIRAAAAQPPRAVLMFGVSGRSRSVRIEKRAVNAVSRAAKDAGGNRPPDSRLERCDGVIRTARAPVQAALHAMHRAGLSAEASHSAGRYVCNAAYWQMLGNMPRDTQVLFVHIPLMLAPGTKKRDPRPAFSRLLMGAKRVARMMIIASRLTR